MVEVDPNYANAHITLLLIYMQTGDDEKWLREWEKEAQLAGDAFETARFEVAKKGYAKSGYRGATKEVADWMADKGKHGYVDPACIAMHYAQAGEKDQAFAFLEQGLAEKSGLIVY